MNTTDRIRIKLLRAGYIFFALLSGSLAPLIQHAGIKIMLLVSFIVCLYSIAQVGRPDPKTTPPDELLQFDIGMD